MTATRTAASEAATRANDSDGSFASNLQRSTWKGGSGVPGPRDQTPQDSQVATRLVRSMASSRAVCSAMLVICLPRSWAKSRLAQQAIRRDPSTLPVRQRRLPFRWLLAIAVRRSPKPAQPSVQRGELRDIGRVGLLRSATAWFGVAEVLLGPVTQPYAQRLWHLVSLSGTQTFVEFERSVPFASRCGVVVCIPVGTRETDTSIDLLYECRTGQFVGILAILPGRHGSSSLHREQ